MNVIKRDGRVVKYDENKVIKALEKAFAEIDGEVTKGDSYLINDIVYDLSNNIVEEGMTVEEIQDEVEDELMESRRKDVARAYVRYRYKRELVRDAQTNLDKEIAGLKDGTSEEVTNNANKAGDKLQVLKAMISDVACIDQATRYYIPEEIMKHHKKEIYSHDMNFFGSVPMVNCMVTNWQYALEHGVNLGGANISKPKSFETAVAVLSQMVAHITSNCYGGVTIGSISKGLTQYGLMSLNKHREEAKKYVKEEMIEQYAWDMLHKEIKNGCQSLEYEINTLVTGRSEQPFLTVELDVVDLDAPEVEQKIQKMILCGILNNRIKGFDDGSTPVFPKLVFETKRGNNLDEGDPYHDIFELAIKCSSTRIYPDYLNYDKTVEVTGSYKAPMGCRSFLPKLTFEDGNERPFGFNCGVVSINLVRLAIQSNHDEEKFYKLLDKYLDMSKELLLIRHKSLRNVKAEQAPILFQSGVIDTLKDGETIEKLLYKDRSSISIGYVGLHNAMIALYGDSFATDRSLINKAEKIMQYMADYCTKAKNETNIGFSLYSTPAETLATKFCTSDVEEYGVIKGVNDKGYYENSFHFPSGESIIPFDKISLESNFSKIATGGAIQYCEFGDMKHNTKALEEIVRYSYDKCHYFGVNPAASTCKCGFRGEMISLDDTNNKYMCPQCGNTDKNTMSVVVRLCGYLSTLNLRPTIWGKMKEINGRYKTGDETEE